MPLIRIEDLDDPRLDIYRDLPSARKERKPGRFLAEGRLLVERLLASGWPLESLLVDEQRLEHIEQPVPPELPVYVVPRGMTQRIVGFQFHRGVVACGLRPPNCSPRALPLEPDGRWVVPVCLEIQDPENLGGILRNAAAFGAPGVILGPRCADPLSRRVLRVSMGAPFYLPIAWLEDVAELDELRRSFQAVAVATVLDDRAQPLPSVVRPERVLLLLGNEGHGLPPFWRSWADCCWTIPMAPPTDSLNVSVAAAIFLYQLTCLCPAQDQSESMYSLKS
ncbi:MAG: rRNA methyltransferase [Pirellulaceae bacterium]|nr:MAG: rRNA methyltransferase [Pirellulaceae bacterium]